MKFYVVICCFFLMGFAQVQGQELTRILFILDASNSMNANWGGQTRIEAAKELLVKTVDSLNGSANLQIALRVYGHQSPITATYQDCNDTKLEVPFGPDNFTRVKNKIKTILAKGTTPIARSLEAAASDFPDTNARNIIILITDGLEACDNDPCVIAKKLHDKGVKVTPFVIGLGLDLSYLEQFKCIGSYSEAETKEAFSNVLKSVISKAIINTTVQINLNNINKVPNETDVTMFLYKAGTKDLVYTFVHTLNRQGSPDTLTMDPNFKYDLVVNTIPKVYKNNISIIKNTHNIIPVDCPQGYIRLRFTNATSPYQVLSRIYQKNEQLTLNTQSVGTTDKYIVGTYEVEILTLPRIYQTVEVTQSTTQTIDLAAPGQFSYSATKAIAAQLFVIRENGNPEWVCNLEQSSTKGLIFLQPGNYRVVYRQKQLRSTTYTTEKNFKIQSNKTTSINL
ncbi:VWA domain-containing protein [Fluviicola sp.]|jgi:Ca-activated chloride channel family protein|uniref:vWA domain-containing protein n=1 Tax=Fluviicola sp. TaxID=1917219 RepID=UPI002832B213|nr:VWA domain-containing protein [Fluviicola sp.]MDR0803089.1 VWA domain-containing protein [Fluviicola sp.]